MHLGKFGKYQKNVLRAMRTFVTYSFVVLLVLSWRYLFLQAQLTL